MLIYCSFSCTIFMITIPYSSLRAKGKLCLYRFLRNNDSPVRSWFALNYPDSSTRKVFSSLRPERYVPFILLKSAGKISQYILAHKLLSTFFFVYRNQWNTQNCCLFSPLWKKCRVEAFFKKRSKTKQTLFGSICFLLPQV